MSTITANATQGLRLNEARVAQAADLIARNTGNTDDELIASKVAEGNFAANATVLRTGRELEKKLIDILA